MEYLEPQSKRRERVAEQIRDVIRDLNKTDWDKFEDESIKKNPDEFYGRFEPT